MADRAKPILSSRSDSAQQREAALARIQADNARIQAAFWWKTVASTDVAPATFSSRSAPEPPRGSQGGAES